MSPRWIVVVALFVVATLLAIVAGRLQRKDEGFMSFLVAIGLTSQVVIPDFWRAVALASLVFVACLSVGAAGIGALVAGFLIVAYFVIPGGTSALILGVVAIVAIFMVVDRVRLRRRTRRAEALVPGDRPKHDVEIAGKVRLRVPLTVPGQPDLRPGFFRVVREDGVEHDSPAVTLEVVTAHGVALAELTGARLMLSRTKRLDAAATMAILGPMALPADKEPPKPCAADLHWIEDGDAVFVVGTPVWERAPGLGDGYRDSPLVPVFRTTKESRVFLADKSEEEVRLATTFEIWAWSAWGASCAAIATLQFAGIV